MSNYHDIISHVDVQPNKTCMCRLSAPAGSEPCAGFYLHKQIPPSLFIWNLLFYLVWMHSREYQSLRCWLKWFFFHQFLQQELFTSTYTWKSARESRSPAARSFCAIWNKVYSNTWRGPVLLLTCAEFMMPRVNQRIERPVTTPHNREFALRFFELFLIKLQQDGNCSVSYISGGEDKAVCPGIIMLAGCHMAGHEYIIWLQRNYDEKKRLKDLERLCSN